MSLTAENEPELDRHGSDEQRRLPLPCNPVDTNITALFFSNKSDEIEAAKELCRSCVMRAPCLSRAFRVGAEHGVWGGFDEIERGYYRKLYGTTVRRIQELPPGLVRRLTRARKGRL